MQISREMSQIRQLFDRCYNQATVHLHQCIIERTFLTTLLNISIEVWVSMRVNCTSPGTFWSWLRRQHTSIHYFCLTSMTLHWGHLDWHSITRFLASQSSTDNQSRSVTTAQLFATQPSGCVRVVCICDLYSSIRQPRFLLRSHSDFLKSLNPSHHGSACCAWVCPQFFLWQSWDGR